MVPPVVRRAGALRSGLSRDARKFMLSAAVLRGRRGGSLHARELTLNMSPRQRLSPPSLPGARTLPQGAAAGGFCYLSELLPAIVDQNKSKCEKRIDGAGRGSAQNDLGEKHQSSSRTAMALISIRACSRISPAT